MPREAACLRTDTHARDGNMAAQIAGYATDLISVYWSKPATPFWRPTPLALYPPNGVSAPYGAPPLTPMKPALIRRATASECSREPDITLPAKPDTLSFAIRI